MQKGVLCEYHMGLVTLVLIFIIKRKEADVAFSAAR